MKIHVALAADQNYFDGLFVAATSIAATANSACELVIHVLDGGICEKDIRLLRERISKIHAQSEVVCHTIDEKVFEGYQTWAGLGRMTYARLLLPILLPNVEWCIYVDCDILWNRDVADLWGQMSDDVSFISIHEEWQLLNDRESSWFKAKGLRLDISNYFTASLSFFNLERFRELKLADQAFSFLNKYKDVQWPDQSALNAVFSARRDLKIVPEYWSCTNWLLNRRILKDSGGAVVLHFAGNAPWKSLHQNRLLSDATLAWFRMDAYARGCTVWTSLRRYYSPTLIIGSRILFLIGSLGWIGRKFIWLLLLLRGHPEAHEGLVPFLHRYHVDSFFPCG